MYKFTIKTIDHTMVITGTEKMKLIKLFRHVFCEESDTGGPEVTSRTLRDMVENGIVCHYNDLEEVVQFLIFARQVDDPNIAVDFSYTIDHYTSPIGPVLFSNRFNVPCSTI